MTSIGVVIITHKAKKHLPFLLPPLLASSLKPRILLVNSSSHDGTVELAKDFGVETYVCPRSEFNHGTTREKARKLMGGDIVVMMTPDAYLYSQDSLKQLVQPIIHQEAEATYARQIPHVGAKLFESFPREFNYPEQGHIRELKDREKWGITSIFCSNSCAAWKNSALDDVGGFEKVLMGEDALAAAKLLLKGYRIAYVAEAKVHHSHGYTLLEQFRRHFDIGLERRARKELYKIFGEDERKGREYVRVLCSTLIKKAPNLLPYALLETLTKWAGYRLGWASQNAPVQWKKMLSSQDFYWMKKGEGSLQP